MYHTITGKGHTQFISKKTSHVAFFTFGWTKGRPFPW